MSIDNTTESTMTDTDSGLTVLHVEDDQSFADLTATYIEREDSEISVETELKAQAGLDRLSEDIDCIVSDYDMPGMNGIEFLEAVREEYTDLPFILFTGKGSEEIASEAISAGVTDYLQKQAGTEQYAILCNRIKNVAEWYHRGQRLRQTKRRFEKVFEQSNDGILILDPHESEIRRVNARACKLLGYDRDELLSLTPADIHPHEVHRFRQFVDEIYNDGTGWTEELSCLTKDGTELPAHISASTITIDDNQCLLALIRSLDGQTESHPDAELIRTLLDHSTDGIYVIDPKTGEFVDVNETACQRLGYDREELLSMTVPDIDGSGTIDDWNDHVDRVLTAEQISTGMSHQRKDGSTYPVELRGEHVARSGGEHYLIATARDISKRHRREQTVEALLGTVRALADADTFGEAAETVVQAGPAVFDTPVGIVWSDYDRGDEFEPIAWTNRAAELLGNPPTVSAGSPIRSVLETGESQTGTIASEPEIAGVENVRKGIILPFGAHGVVLFGSSTAKELTDTEQLLIEYLTTNLKIVGDYFESDN